MKGRKGRKSEEQRTVRKVRKGRRSEEQRKGREGRRREEQRMGGGKGSCVIVSMYGQQVHAYIIMCDYLAVKHN